MDSMSLISVILPTYNRADVLKRAINSVFAQTYSDWELIVWDDGSTDSTEDILTSLNDKRVRYFHEGNHGAAYARNRAVEKAGGKYLAFLDSDDEWKNNKLAIQAEIMRVHPEIDCLFSNFLNINIAKNRQVVAFDENADAMKLLDTKRLDVSLFVIVNGLLPSLTINNLIATDSILLNREVFERLGGFKEILTGSEDFELWWRMGLSGVCFAYIDQVLITRFKPPRSLSSSSLKASDNIIKALDLILQETLSKGRADLFNYLNNPYRNAWQNRITVYASSGNRKGMINAFIQSLKYGFRMGSLRLLVNAILGFNRRDSE
jgi:glycosyltransferase involved in cell wall biosynthesis